MICIVLRAHAIHVVFENKRQLLDVYAIVYHRVREPSYHSTSQAHSFWLLARYAS